jgi:MFS family permease
MTQSRAFAGLCATAFAAYSSYALCRTPLLPLFAQDLGASPSMIGFIVGASTLTGVAVKLPAGALCDVLGRRPLLLAGALVFALMPFTYLGIATLAGLVLVRFLHGNATAIFGPVASATVSDLAPPDRRGSWLAAYATAQGAGQALGPLAAGYLLTAGRFDLAFVTAGVVGLAAPIIVAAWVPASPPRRTAARWPAFRDGIREVVGHRLVLITSAAHAAQFVLNGALNAFLPLYARDVVGLTTAELGWLFAAQTLTTLAMRPMVGAISDRVSRRVVIITGLSLCSMTVWALAVITQGWMLAACLVVYAAGVATTSAATSAFVTDISRRARYGAAHGVFGTIYDIGDALGPIGAGLVVASTGYPTLFTVLAAIGMTAAVAFAAASRVD